MGIHLEIAFPEWVILGPVRTHICQRRGGVLSLSGRRPNVVLQGLTGPTSARNLFEAMKDASGWVDHWACR